MSGEITGYYVCENCTCHFRRGDDGIRCPRCGTEFVRKMREADLDGMCNIANCQGLVVLVPNDAEQADQPIIIEKKPT